MTAGRSHLQAVPSRAAQREYPVQVQRPPARRVRRLRRRRRLAGLIRFTVFLLLIFLAVWAGVRVAHAGADATLYTGHEYTVQSGDTLWGIAAGEYGPSTDLRAAVYAIREANGLDGSTVQPGRHLTLPYLGD